MAVIETKTMNRRSLLAIGVRLSFVGSVLPATAAHAALCVDPEELSSTDYSFRKYVQYTESSPNPDKACRRCASFRPPDQGDCGKCQQVAGSVNANGHCNGWEARVEKK